MNEICAELHLGPEAISYIQERLANGKTLARYLLQRPDLESGTVTTFLPSDVGKEAATQFKWGGKLRRDPATFVYHTEPDGSTTRWEPVPDTDPWLALLLQEFLRGTPEGICIFENSSALPRDPWLQSSDLQTLIFGDEVYHFVSHRDAENEKRILETIRGARSWLFYGVATSSPNPGDVSLEAGTIGREFLEVCAQRAEKIVVGAYDGESHLIWSKPAS